MWRARGFGVGGWLLAVGPAVHAPRAEAGEEHGARGGHTRLYARSRAQSGSARAVVGSTSRLKNPRPPINVITGYRGTVRNHSAFGPRRPGAAAAPRSGQAAINVKSAIAGRA